MRLNGFLILFLLAACQQQQPNQPQRTNASANAHANLKEPFRPAEETENKGVLSEPKGPIDPKSVEAAGQVVQSYGALIEQGRWAEAAKLWSNADAAASFAKELRPATHLEIGDLGATAGAAGSIYTAVPVGFYRDTFRRPANIILRRVNDVPGSTEEQRRWHIERIEWTGS